MNATLDNDITSIISPIIENNCCMIRQICTNVKMEKSIKYNYNKSKRIFDIFFSVFALTVFSPLFLIISLVIKIISPDGPVFFNHKRIGLKGKEFNCYKFRTMLPNAEQLLNKMLEENAELKAEFQNDFKLKNDNRIIPIIGKLLRKSSLDELPQFINTLIGDMSIVGPRPIVNSEKRKYGKAISKFLSVKPGITGLWQVSGRNNVSYEKRVCLDIEYIDKNNFLMDLQIILKTIVVMLFRDGAY